MNRKRGKSGNGEEEKEREAGGVRRGWSWKRECGRWEIGEGEPGEEEGVCRRGRQVEKSGMAVGRIVEGMRGAGAGGGGDRGGPAERRTGRLGARRSEGCWGRTGRWRSSLEREVEPEEMAARLSGGGGGDDGAWTAAAWGRQRREDGSAARRGSGDGYGGGGDTFACGGGGDGGGGGSSDVNVVGGRSGGGSGGDGGWTPSPTFREQPLEMEETPFFSQMTTRVCGGGGGVLSPLSPKMTTRVCGGGGGSLPLL